MKIEKLNDNQIRCTLTRADLADREIKISELVCGTEKAKSLFQDMMRQASKEFGFEAEDIPEAFSVQETESVYCTSRCGPITEYVPSLSKETGEPFNVAA